MIFSRTAFEATAPANIKKCLPESHREALDGKAVIFDSLGFGTVDYSADGEDFYLYPVDKDWCEDGDANVK
jgi:hypothetical protein